jgi:hypothetical protein
MTAGKGVIFLAPFGWDQRTLEPAIGVQVLSGRYAYYQPLLNERVPSQKVAELEADPSTPLLLPDLASACGQNDAARRRRLSAMLDAIYLPPTVHQVIAAQVLCDYIGAHYRVSDLTPSDDPAYAIWVRIR